MTKRLSACLRAALLLATLASPAPAAEIDGIALPERLQAAGTPLKLNGIGLRTFSLLRIHVYVAALYLQQPSSNAEAILHSDTIKLLDIRFVHDVTVDRAREAWRTGFRDNCLPPCRLAEGTLDKFIEAVPEFHKGDQSTLLFADHGVSIEVNGRLLGKIDDPVFSEAMLANFIGPHPPTESFKRALLGGR